MKKLIAFCICLIFVYGCTDAPKARSVLNSQGFKEVNITGYNFMACSKDDFYSTGFTATTSAGTRVSGTVCTGLFKGSTIRFD